MVRVERRNRRRRRIRAMWLRVLSGAVLLICLALLIYRKPALQAELISPPTPTSTVTGYDQTDVTREVLLPAETWYAIQTGVFSGAEAAQDKAAAYADRGAPGTVVSEGGKWRVFIACYGSESDASAVRKRLGEQQRVETYLYAWSCPELRLRLSGMAGQLDVAEAGLMLMNQAGGILRDTAILLDAAQLTTEEATRTISELNGQIQLWTETAEERFGRKPPELIAQLMKLAGDWSVRYGALMAGADSATTLSAVLKGQGMELYEEMIRFRNSFAGM